MDSTIVQTFRDDFFPKIADSLGYFGAELQIAFCAIAILLLDLVIPKSSSRHLAWLAVFGCVYAATSVFSIHEDKELFLGMIAVDSFANFFKLFFLFGGVPIILLSFMSKELEGKRMGEYYAILLFSILGDLTPASQRNSISAWMGISMGLGQGVGQGVAGYFGAAHVWGWRAPFVARTERYRRTLLNI